MQPFGFRPPPGTRAHGIPAARPVKSDLVQAAGEGHFALDGKETTVPAGNMVLYQPKQEQHYYFLGKDLSKYWFVHFTGRQVRNILRHYEIPTGSNILPTGISYEYEDLFRQMRDELLTMSPKQFLVDLRIRKAQVLLETTDGTVNEISRAVGYDNPMYFSRLFRKVKGLSPLKYRKIYREHFTE